MNSPGPSRKWYLKFRNAFRGAGVGIRGQSSFKVHFFFAAAAIAAGAVLRIDDVRRWCLLILCITAVFTAELFNSALEHMSRAISRQRDVDLGAALDISSAAVLAASIGAVAVGSIIFLARLGELLALWH